MCGQSTVYNTYATLLPTNPLFQGFSRSQNALKEIIFQQYSASYDVSEKCITPQDFLSWGVFCKNCGTINKRDFTYKILLSSDYQQVNKCRKFLYFMGFELQCIMMIIIRRIFMQSIIEIRQLLKLIQLDASRSFVIKTVKVDFSVVCVTSR